MLFSSIAISGEVRVMSRLLTPVHPIGQKSDTQNQRRSIFGEWCHVTGWHGIQDAYTARNLVSKLVWTLVVSFSLFLAVNQCVALILDYASDDQWTTSVTFQIPSTANNMSDGYAWPNITVTNLETYHGSLLRNWGVDDPFLAAYLKRPDLESIVFVNDMQMEEPLSNRTVLEQMLGTFDQDLLTHLAELTIGNITQILTADCKTTAIHCGTTVEFDLRINATCCEQSSANQNAFSIDSTKVFGKSFGVGRDSSVYLLLDPRTHDYFEYMSRSEIPSAGLRVQFFYGDPEAAEISEILLTPGTHTLISMIRQKSRTVHRQSKTIDFGEIRKRPCTEMANYSHYDYDLYSKKLCSTDCTSVSIYATCGCTIFTPRMIKMKPVKACRGIDFSSCMGRWYQDTQDLNSTRIRELTECWTKCGESCDYDTLDVRVSSSQFPAPIKIPSFTRYLNRALNNSNFTQEDTKQLLLLEMFYETRQIRLVERVTRTTLDELISNIGGAMGVWTGLSILSFYQCAVYMLAGVFCRR